MQEIRLDKKMNIVSRTKSVSVFFESPRFPDTARCFAPIPTFVISLRPEIDGHRGAIRR